MEEKTPNIMNVSMEIILHAGDARENNLMAIDAIAEFDFESAKKHLENATTNITVAHKMQTDQIQDETRGKKSEYSLLFAHAQDTLMTINSEILMSEKLIKTFESVYNKINELEEKVLKLSDENE
ncbi:PTS system cellobiose-specific IIA component [Breznakia sp. PF5-3]|uniref:PTS lactose/cellobiose transporter subunit IIA n=1 Tax=unclassified Breznakia TaxID=2623764 RepID=UPI0024072A62|nr:MULTISPECIES: PTS lactose/cellobiose transporter subunit IIA [unclassified Breznakia]MDF9825708.1 PTS system cellobiose-specific IIA component [Breznakia sp. PM6-1]MDF9836530.1 PTS system cellobiose-specific IIA component [Breznakia sp. PF5-3]MDF9838764.1 PTS system cellobiose-specific IIA component [Breznakia sp. PFB2-8]MDF9860790.1 PTS system cellobiose-specific IIA component [Breznakia sp. PH5-24]